MFTTEGRSNYDAVFEDLLKWFRQNRSEGPQSVVFYGRLTTVRADGIYHGEERLDSIGSILVLRYLITSGTSPPSNEWVPYRAFRDGATFALHLKMYVEDVIAKEFAGHRQTLAERITGLGGKPVDFPSTPDLAMALNPFPGIPLLCLFWDADEEFPPAFQFLFDSSAPDYLDLESLAVLLHYTGLKLQRQADPTNTYPDGDTP
jgi:hypothetical protein